MADEELRVRASMQNELSRPLEDVREDVQDVRQELDRTNRAAATTNRRMGGLRSGVGRLASTVKTGLVTALKMGAVALAALGAAAVAGLGKVLSLAMDAGETMSKFNTVFGQNRVEMEKWVQGLHRNFGIATKDLRDAASTFGVFGQAAGIAKKDLPAFSQSLVEAGTDLASFYNVDPGEAFLSLRSGLAGEAEPLRKFGIFLSDASLNAFMAKEGLKGVFSELDEGQKVAIRQQFILANMGKAQGDLARTSDSLANKWKALKGRTTELMTSLGTGLVPVAERVVGILDDKLEPVVTRISTQAPKLAQAFSEGTFYEAVGVMDNMANAGGRLDTKVRQLHASGQLVARIFSTQEGGVAGALAQARAEFPALIPLIDKLEEVGRDLVTIWTDGIQPALTETSKILPDVLQPMKLLDNLIGFVADNAKVLSPLLTALISGYVAYKAANFALNTVMAAGNAIRFVTTAATAGLAAAQAGATTSTGALAAGTMTLNAIMAINPVVLVVTAIAALAAGLVIAYKRSETFRDAVHGLWNGLKVAWEWVKKGIGFLGDLFLKFTPLGRLIKHFPEILGAAGRAWETFKTAVGSVIDWIMDKIGPLVDAVGKVAGGIGKLGGAAGRVGSWINPFGDTATSKAPGGNIGTTLGIHGRVESMTPGSRTITSAVRSWGASGDHQRGSALDLVGSNLNTYANNVRAMGGFAEFHGRGRARHLHAAYPAGDTATPKARALRLRPAGGGGGTTTMEVGALVHVENLNGADIEELEGVVLRAYGRIKRDEEERS